MHRTRHGEADERQDGQARPGRPATKSRRGAATRTPRAGAGEEEQRKQVRKALDEGENVKAKVTVRATDEAGNVATAKRTITLVK